MKCKNVLLCLLLFNITITVNSQISFLFSPSAYSKDIKGLLYVNIVNSTGREFKANLDIEVKFLNGSSSSAFFKLLLADIQIGKGSSLITNTKFTEMARYYENSAIGNYVKETSQMPEGELEYCFKLSELQKENIIETYQECFTGSNIISTPLELDEPQNRDELCNKRPKFIWTPPLPLQSYSTFSLKLVELKPDQSKAEALLLNNPIIFLNEIHGNTLNYPSSAIELKEGVKYAWQITTITKGQLISSDIWEFKINCNADKKLKQSDGYIEITDDNKMPFVNSNAILKFTILNPFIAQSLHYTIIDLAEPNKKIRALPKLNLENGKNYLQINLNSVVGLDVDKEYALNIVLPNGKKASLRFKYDNIDE